MSSIRDGQRVKRITNKTGIVYKKDWSPVDKFEVFPIKGRAMRSSRTLRK
jgi:hypothetical protein